MAFANRYQNSQLTSWNNTSFSTKTNKFEFSVKKILLKYGRKNDHTAILRNIDGPSTDKLGLARIGTFEQNNDP